MHVLNHLIHFFPRLQWLQWLVHLFLPVSFEKIQRKRKYNIVSMNKYLLKQFMAWELLAEMVYWSKESRQMKPKKTELISGSGPLRS